MRFQIKSLVQKQFELFFAMLMEEASIENKEAKRPGKTQEEMVKAGKEGRKKEA